VAADAPLRRLSPEAVKRLDTEDLQRSEVSKARNEVEFDELLKKHWPTQGQTTAPRNPKKQPRRSHDPGQE
jgi:hypothetical protein